MIMVEEIDYTEVPYLQEILNYLPINPDDEEDINSYVNNCLLYTSDAADEL